MMEIMKLTNVLTFVLVVVVVNYSGVCQARASPPAPVTEEALHKVAAKLKMFVEELPQMPKIRGYEKDANGVLKPVNLKIGMYQKKWKFHPDLPATTVFAYGTSESSATVPGPTIEAIRGVPLSVTWENHLPKSHFLPYDPTIPTAIPKHGGVPTVVHLHGGIQPPQFDGSALAWFTSNYTETGPHWTQPTYNYPNVQHGGNLWYHDHALGLTRVNLLAGLIGAYMLKDIPLESKLNLPQDEFDIHLMIFDRSFRTDGSLYMNSTGNNPTIHPQWQPEYFGDAIIVNGKAWPYLKVKPRKYRFRIINASNARFYRLALTKHLSFIQVGSDASYLPTPIYTRHILLAPSEIADVIVDFSKLKIGDECLLTNDAKYPYPTGDKVDELNSKILKFKIESDYHDHEEDYSQVPKKLASYPKASTQEATKLRYISLVEYESATTDDPIRLLINGKKFGEPATETPKTGSTEVWEVINLTEDNHPFHIHLGKFQAIKIQKLIHPKEFTACMVNKTNFDAVACNLAGHAKGKLFPVPAYEKTWKNVVKMKPGYVTTIVVKFNLVENNAPYPFDATAEPGYVYHCHILDHEDNVMVRPLKLVA
ncbi:OLC1v1014282C1 [Oldenlandia corymbosa var. corymbosa]|uniref:OLC1v1014282C1 n=1 Tax=Oldenlandia corymbosa var. corymbosa TaxID=529605 RepID=A0AAV1E3X9_OLDCO|nr:OLC1v1014282C1 [Oldenlandia corymbosa var. corymbosa]